jgi:hypothetical protein
MQNLAYGTKALVKSFGRISLAKREPWQKRSKGANLCEALA